MFNMNTVDRYTMDINLLCIMYTWKRRHVGEKSRSFGITYRSLKLITGIWQKLYTKFVLRLVWGSRVHRESRSYYLCAIYNRHNSI